MARDAAYEAAEAKIQDALRTGASRLDLSGMGLTDLPASVGQLTQLQKLNLYDNRLRDLPASVGRLIRLWSLDLNRNQLAELPSQLGQLSQLQHLDMQNNRLVFLPDSLGDLSQLWYMYISNNNLTKLPDSLGQLRHLRKLELNNNSLRELPSSLGELTRLQALEIDDNPLNPELATVYKQNLTALKAYLSAQAKKSIVLNEAKLVLIGEGEVGKSCLLGALRGDPWDDNRVSTHGIEIKPVKVAAPGTQAVITLNGWDFGGQRVYRPTHQLFFSAPAVYLVVWKPREGIQAGQVKEWIKLVKHRAPEAKIFVVATHGGPQDRQPDIDRQEFWDLFGKDTVVDFFHVESMPPVQDKLTGKRTGSGKGIVELRDAIACVAAKLPEVGRTVPQSWQEARIRFQKSPKPYLPLADVLRTCEECGMSDELAQLFVTVSHQLGHLIHYGHDPSLRNIVILKPDWLATAISFVLDDQLTRTASGLVSAERLSYLWNDPTRPEEFRYTSDSHAIFRRLMERYDISYRVALPATVSNRGSDPEIALIGQLVPDVRPTEQLTRVWPPTPFGGETQQTQICKIVDTQNKSAAAEGLLYQIIVRLHRYSLGRASYDNSVHWQRGVVLEDTYGSRALLEHIENDIRIAVRAPYPERFLSALTYEVQYLVESFWRDLRCRITVPCLNPLGLSPPCLGVFEVEKLIENKRRNRSDQPCPACNEWQSIEKLLHNAPSAQPDPFVELALTEMVAVRAELKTLSATAADQHDKVIGRFDQSDAAADVRGKALGSKVEAVYDRLIRTMVDEGKDGPRLFHFEPVNSTFFSLRDWTSERFRFTLWCEHSRLPLPVLNASLGTPDEKRGVYEVTVPRAWVASSVPFLKGLVTTLGWVVPLAGALAKVTIDETVYKSLERQLDAGQKAVESVLKGAEKLEPWASKDDAPDLDRGALAEGGSAVCGAGGALRQLHTWLKEKDPGFGGLVRVLNKRNEFMWVHPHFEGEY